MSRIARSEDPLFQTRGRPVAMLFEHRQPNGMATDLTGCTVSAVIAWRGAVRTLTVGPVGPSGDIVVTGAANLTSTIPLGRLSELRLTIVDSLGAAADLVFPIVGEEP